MSEASNSSDGFYKVPNEDEIHAQLDMEEKMQKLASEIEEKRKELEYHKERMLEKKIKEIEDKKVQLKQRLEEIDKMPDYEDSEDKMRAIEIKKKAIQWEQKEREKHDELVALRKEQELEKIVRKKMELERLMEERKKLHSDYKQIATQLDVIREEKEKKDMDSVKLLERALERGNVLKDQIKKGALSEEDKALLAETYLQDRIDSKNIQERLLQEVQAHRFQESQKANLDTKEKIKNLNDIRFALREKEEKLLKQKALHHEIMKRGVDYMAEIELGNAPPRELIEKNITYNPDDYRNTKNLNDVLQHGKKYIAEAEERIEEARLDHERMMAYLARHKEYKGELKPLLAMARPQSLEMARYILGIVLEKVGRYIDNNQEKVERARREAELLQNKVKKVEKKQNLFVLASAAKGVGVDLVERVADAMAREVAYEMWKINEDARKLTNTIIFRSLRIQRNLPKTDSQLQKAYFEFREGDPDDEKHKLRFKDKEDIATKDIKVKKKNDNPNEDDDEKDFYEIDLEPERLCVENLGSYELRKLELDYFDKFVLQENDVIQAFAKIKGGISAMIISQNGHLLAISTTSGIIGVLSLKLNPPQIYLVAEESNFIPVILKFSQDSSSQLVALDANGLLKTYLLNGNPAAKLGTLSWLPLKENEMRPLQMTEYYSIDAKYVTLQKNKNTNEKDGFKLMQCEFFSTFTILGFQTSLIVGTKNGTIAKYNNNKKLGGTNMQNSLFKTTNMKTIVKTDVDLNKESEPIKAKAGPKDSEPHVYREFFVGHQTEILFMGFIDKPQNLVTIDKEGRIFIWEYNEKLLNKKSNTFETKERYKIKLDLVIYQASSEKVQTFPPKDVKINQQAITKEGEAKFKDYDVSADFKAKVLNMKKNAELGVTEMTAIKTKAPEAGQMEPFIHITLNNKERKVILEQEQSYKGINVKGFVGKIQGSANNKFIYVQLILPHKLKPESSNIVFVGFNTMTYTLRKLKVTLEVPRLDHGLDFLVSDNNPPYGGSYIYILLRDGIYVISTATGLIVRIFKDHLQNPSMHRRNDFDLMQISRSRDVYLASSSSGLIWRFKVQDTNTPEDVEEARRGKPEFLKLLNM